MAQIGIFCPPVPGHLHPLATLGRALQKRGHEVLAFQIPEMRDRIKAEKLGFRPLGNESLHNGEIARATEELGRRKGLSALRFTLDCGRRLTSIICEHGPEAVRSAGIELLLIDDNEPGGGTVAEHLGLPYINFGSIPLYREPSVPPAFVPWSYSSSRIGQVRNQFAYAVFNRLVSQTQRVLNDYRAKWGLPPIRQPQDTLSPFAQLSQLVEEFDYPRSRKPACLHYVGPLYDDARPSVPFPFEQLNGKPLIYASFGTLQNQREEYFHAVAQACLDLDAQLVISTGGSHVGELTNLAESVIAVQYAPQLELLARARLCITHGGLNTVMESLRFGVPLVAVPITNDQPAVAARIRWTGVGEVVSLSMLLRGGAKPAVERVWNAEHYRAAAMRIRTSVLQAGGLERAAGIVEQVLATGKPVTTLAAAANV
jgi:zeaxanthin glucosyltransferase